MMLLTLYCLIAIISYAAITLPLRFRFAMRRRIFCAARHAPAADMLLPPL